MIDRRMGKDLAAALRESEHGRALAEAGFAEDVAECARLDTYPVVPVYRDRQLVRSGPARRR